MAWVERLVTRTTQPQDACAIDWSNPLTKGLISALSPKGDAVTQKAIRQQGTPVITPNATGLAVIGTGNSYIKSVIAPTVFNKPEVTLFYVGSVSYTINSLPASVTGSGGTQLLTFIYDSSGRQNVVYRATNGGGALTRLYETFAPVGIFKWAATYDGTSDLKIYVDGASVTANGTLGTLNNATPSGFDSVSLGGADRASDLFQGSGGQANVVFAWSRALSAAEHKSLSDNPWQIFEPEVSRVWVDDFVSGGAVTGNATGSLSAVSLSPVSGTASGSAFASSSISAISLSVVNGTASGSSTAAGVFAPISLSPVAGLANGAANASASLAPISLIAITGTANGSTVVAGNASGAFDDVALSPVSGTASGTASANGALSAISLTAINGTASGGAIVAGNASGAFDDVSLTSLTGTAAGGSAGIAAGVFASLSINPATGAAYGAAVAVGILPVIALTPLTGSATGVSIIPAYASGDFDDITLSPLTGVAAVIRRIRPIVPNYNTMSVDASYNVAYIDPTYWID